LIWHPIELSLRGRRERNGAIAHPFLDFRLTVTFTARAAHARSSWFFDGDGAGGPAATCGACASRQTSRGRGDTRSPCGAAQAWGVARPWRRVSGGERRCCRTVLRVVACRRPARLPSARSPRVRRSTLSSALRRHLLDQGRTDSRRISSGMQASTTRPIRAAPAASRPAERSSSLRPHVADWQQGDPD